MPEAHRCGKPGGTPVTMVMARWEETTERFREACGLGSPAFMTTVQVNERHCFKGRNPREPKLKVDL